MATAAKFMQPIPIFLAYLAPLDVDVVSYQVSSISVWQVTYYDNFCVFRIFRILAISMAMAAIWKNQPLTWHMIFLQGFIKFDQGISEKSSGQKCVEEE